MFKTQGMQKARGFSLVELMVGLVIGMVGVVIMMQIFSVSEGYKRSTTGGDDAQNNGAISLYGLQRDLRQAGQGSYSFTDNAAAANAYALIGCNLTLRAGVTVNALGPVTINHPDIPDGDANTDTLLVFYGNGNDGPEGDRIEAQPATTTYTLAGFAVAASAPSVSFSANDRVVAHPTPRPSPCNLTMESVTAVAISNVTVGTGVAGMTGGALFNLGQAPRLIAYAVRNGSLTMCDYMVNDCAGAVGAQWVQLASNVVSLRAQYGRDTTAGTMDGTVDVYDQTTPANVCQWVRMRAIRVAVVARSAQLEKDNVASAPVWGGAASQPIDLSDDADWQRYRYKTFETVVPLRNVAWMGVQAGC